MRTHGVRSTYVKGCRCDECRAANAEGQDAFRRWSCGPTRAEYLAGLPRAHGIISRYNGGCRCDECRRAAADQRARMRANARLRAGQAKKWNNDWVIDYRLGRLG